MDLSTFLNTPIEIRGRTLAGRLVLAPMAGLTHVALRELLDRFGGFGLLYTEMASARAVPSENRRVSPVFAWRDEELPRLVCQLFGPEPEMMAEAARRVEAEGFFGVDMNFGCCAAAIRRQDSGAALLSRPSAAAAIVEEVRKAVSIPLLVKFRNPPTGSPDSCVDLARRFEDAGADALVFHPRTAPDARTRPPVWGDIARVRQAVAIPVFGNGNVFLAGDCERLLETTGCDGVSIGRIAAARPWTGAEWCLGLAPDSGVYERAAMDMAGLCERHFDPRRAYLRFRKWATYFSANFAFGHALDKSVGNAGDLEHARRAVSRFFESEQPTLARPNPNLFS
ncbi:MAG: tRNA dihydrouridine synthase [Desulfatibacillaceae bacterium]